MSRGHNHNSKRGKQAVTGPLSGSTGMCAVRPGEVCWGNPPNRQATAAAGNDCSPSGCSRTAAEREG